MHINKISISDKFHALFDLQPNNSITNDPRKKKYSNIETSQIQKWEIWRMGYSIYMTQDAIDKWIYANVECEWIWIRLQLQSRHHKCNIYLFRRFSFSIFFIHKTWLKFADTKDVRCAIRWIYILLKQFPGSFALENP